MHTSNIIAMLIDTSNIIRSDAPAEVDSNGLPLACPFAIKFFFIRGVISSRRDLHIATNCEEEEVCDLEKLADSMWVALRAVYNFDRYPGVLAYDVEDKLAPAYVKWIHRYDVEDKLAPAYVKWTYRGNSLDWFSLFNLADLI